MIYHSFQMAIQIRFITETYAAPEYNCRFVRVLEHKYRSHLTNTNMVYLKKSFSAHTPDEWTELYGTKHYPLGIFSMVFPTVCQVDELH